jgi:hypothetical protein
MGEIFDQTKIILVFYWVCLRFFPITICNVVNIKVTKLRLPKKAIFPKYKGSKTENLISWVFFKTPMKKELMQPPFAL